LEYLNSLTCSFQYYFILDIMVTLVSYFTNIEWNKTMALSDNWGRKKKKKICMFFLNISSETYTGLTLDQNFVSQPVARMCIYPGARCFGTTTFRHHDLTMIRHHGVSAPRLCGTNLVWFGTWYKTFRHLSVFRFYVYGKEGHIFHVN
jgi:hypothetical protein